jgi:hypothetical protein
MTGLWFSLVPLSPTPPRGGRAFSSPLRGSNDEHDYSSAYIFNSLLGMCSDPCTGASQIGNRRTKDSEARNLDSRNYLSAIGFIVIVAVAAWAVGRSPSQLVMKQSTVCYGDLDGSGVIDAADLLQLLASWGPCPGPYVAEVPGVYLCPEDLTGPTGFVDGWVGVPDLLLILGAWDGCACYSDHPDYWVASWPNVPHDVNHNLPCTSKDIDHWCNPYLDSY